MTYTPNNPQIDESYANISGTLIDKLDSAAKAAHLPDSGIEIWNIFSNQFQSAISTPNTQLAGSRTPPIVFVFNRIYQEGIKYIADQRRIGRRLI